MLKAEEQVPPLFFVVLKNEILYEKLFCRNDIRLQNCKLRISEMCISESYFTFKSSIFLSFIKPSR